MRMCTRMLSVITVLIGVLMVVGCTSLQNNEVQKFLKTSQSDYDREDKSTGSPEFIETVISENWVVVEHSSQDLNIEQPMGIACDHGKIFICDSSENTIKVFDNKFDFLYSVGSTGNEMGSFLNPSDISILDERAYILDSGNNRLQIIDLEGRPVSAEHLLNLSASQNEYYSHLAVLSPSEFAFTVQDIGEDAKIYWWNGRDIETIYSPFMGSVYGENGKTYAVNLYEFTKMSTERTVAESGENSLLIFNGGTLESEIKLPYMYSTADFVVMDEQLFVLSYLWNRLDRFDLQGNYIETIAQFSFDPGKPIKYSSYLAVDKESSTFYITVKENSMIYEVYKREK